MKEILNTRWHIEPYDDNNNILTGLVTNFGLHFVRMIVPKDAEEQGRLWFYKFHVEQELIHRIDVAERGLPMENSKW